eukprot:m.335150 g.335150  ORF g.335150 m.335150 type:complete len:532 (+) comp17523_c0_seq1:263-1858(+)
MGKEEIDMEAVGIANFYAGRSVLVTGGTGFVGKAIVEKMLRSCPGIKRIYLLIRERKDASPEERVASLLEEDVFRKAKELYPGCTDKVQAIRGDLAEEDLGIPPAQQEELRKNATIVFHIAATVKFQEKIKVATELNVVAVQRLITFARTLDTIDCFVHTSTAYTQTHVNQCEEKFYPTTRDPEKTIQMLQLMDDDVAEACTPKIISPHPNTYTFTKSLGEHVAKSMCSESNIPLALVRPSIVVCSWRDPYPGWTDSLNGPAGFMTMTGAGLLRVIQADPTKKPHLVPVDIVANCLIAAGRQGHLRNDCSVYNCVGGLNRPDWKAFCEQVVQSWEKYPMQDRKLRKPAMLAVVPQGTQFSVWHTISHVVPAQIFDLVWKLAGQRPMVGRAFKRTSASFREYKPWMHKDWEFDTNNMDDLQKGLSDFEKREFQLETNKTHFPTFMDNYVLGIKKFILKEENPMDGSQAKRKLQYLGMQETLVRVLLWAAFLRLLVKLNVLAERSSKATALLVVLLTAFSKVVRRATLHGTLN